MKNSFRASGHPDVMNGRRSEEEVFDEVGDWDQNVCIGPSLRNRLIMAFLRVYVSPLTVPRDL